MNLTRRGRHAAPFILLAILFAGFLLIIVPGTTAQQILTGASPTFNEYGRLVSTDNYIEIRAAQLYRAGAFYIAKIFVNGTLPKDIEVDGRIRWEILLDTDQNPRTKYAQWTNFSLIDNGIGVDVEAYVEIDYLSHGYFGEIRTSNAVNPMHYSMNGTSNQSSIQMYIDSSVLGNPSAFDFVMLVRKWIGVHMVGADKIPNVGHFTYRNGAVTTIPEFNTGLQVMIVLVTLTASAATAKSRKR